MFGRSTGKTAMQITLEEENRRYLHARVSKAQQQADAMEQVDEKVKELRRNDPYLYHSLMHAEDLSLPEEYAYKIAVVALVEQNKILLQQLTKFAMESPIPSGMILEVLGAIKT